MTKNDIAVALCDRIPELSKSTALNVVDALTDIISESLAAGDNIYLRGFGSFGIKNVKERTARNICAGTTIMVPAQRSVKFKPSKQLKNRMNNGTVD